MHTAMFTDLYELTMAQAYLREKMQQPAHSYIQAHDDEFDAFHKFTAQYPNTTLLVDTYDTLDGVRKVIELQRQLDEQM